MEGFERFSFRGSDCNLSGVDFGRNAGKLTDGNSAPDMILIHGMRDHALSLSSLAMEFARDYHVVMPDLRGHGDSDNPGSYSMMQFVADLRALVQQRQLQNPVVVGHSLGGHIGSRYSAIYSKEIRGLVLIDGMGPPRPGEEVEVSEQQLQLKDNIASLMALTAARPKMATKDEAFDRLVKNNPKLSQDSAWMIVDNGVEPHPDGGVRWKWDPSVNMIWNTFSHDESEQQWSWIECPVLILTGDKAMEYWARHRGELAGKQQLHDAELQRRTKLFRNARSEVIADAGHMIHYDQPELLNRSLRSFVDQIS